MDLLFALIGPIASLIDPFVIVEMATIIETIELVASLTDPLVKTATAVEIDLNESITYSISDHQIPTSKSLESHLTKAKRS